MIGRVCRSPHDLEEPELLGELLTDTYDGVPEEDVDSFIATSTPPEGYVFVIFIQPSHGSSLIHQNDLELVDRVYELGETVKRNLSENDTMSGTIIGASRRCTLKPIIYQPRDPITGDYLPVRFTEKPYKGYETSASEEAGPFLLYDVPQSELRGEEQFSEGDYIIYRQKLGLVQEVEHDVILLLADLRVVSPLDPYALELPISDPASAISSADLKSRDVGNGKYVWTTGTDFNYPGQSVFTERSNLSRADRPLGVQTSVVQGYVLATPAERIHIHWLCSNVFADGHSNDVSTEEVLRASTLQQDAIRCNFTQSPNQDSLAGSCDSVFDVGSYVRFHNPAHAQVNYPGLCQVPSHHSFGYDLNIFQIVSAKTEVTVQWQNGSCTTETATSLLPSDAGGEELYPGDMVALKDSVSVINFHTVKRRTVSRLARGRFNETLRIQQLGIVQTVDSRERIASVRWYRDTDVELINGGNSLNPGCSLGRLGDTITDVSVYELTTFPALSKNLGDLVVVAPASISQSVMSSIPHDIPKENEPRRIHSITADAFLDPSSYLQSIKSALISSEWFNNTTTVRAPSLRRRYSIQNNDAAPPNDFFGKIVAKDTSGNITVRFPGASGCRDIQVPFERILVVITSAGPVTPNVQDDSSFYLNEDTLAGATANECIVKDENQGFPNCNELITSQEGELKIGTIEHGLVTTVSEICSESPMPDDGEIAVDGTSTPAPTKSSLPAILSFPVPTLSPPNFTVLEDLPPVDHHFINQNHAGSSTERMKRIRKEFAILESSLPSGIFVRSWESRIDLLRIIFIGAENTPYEHAPYVVDMHFPADFPHSPPSAFFHSWGPGQGSINPNLSEDGKICLSLLGTWPTQDLDERWSPAKSTVLQLLVSIMGLVLVQDPFYNEAGYESLAAKGSRTIESSQYKEKVFLLTRRFIIHALEHPIRGLEDVLAWNYLPGPPSPRPQLLRKAIREARVMIEHHNCTSESHQDSQASAFCSRLSLGATVLLQKLVSALERLETDLKTRVVSKVSASQGSDLFVS
jgi:ubiquitin-conjugating enzyme E2 O